MWRMHTFRQDSIRDKAAAHRELTYSIVYYNIWFVDWTIGSVVGTLLAVSMWNQAVTMWCMKMCLMVEERWKVKTVSGDAPGVDWPGGWPWRTTGENIQALVNSNIWKTKTQFTEPLAMHNRQTNITSDTRVENLFTQHTINGRNRARQLQQIHFIIKIRLTSGILYAFIQEHATQLWPLEVSSIECWHSF